MNPTRKISDFARSPYTWAVSAGIIVSLFVSVFLTQQIRLTLARSILTHIEQRMRLKTFRKPASPVPGNIEKLARLSLWGETGTGSVTAEPPGSGRSLVPIPGTSLILKGIVRYPDGKFEAVFTDQGSKKSFIVKKGDTLGDLQILAIKPDQVVVTRGGKKSAYFLFTQKSRKVGKTGSPVASPNGANAGQRVVLDKREVQTAISDMASFLRQVRIVPYMDKGKPRGFQLLDIVPGSIVDRVGLKNGDVVERVNGRPIHTPQEAMQLFTLLQSGRGLSIEIKRGNQRKRIAIELK